MKAWNFQGQSINVYNIYTKTHNSVFKSETDVRETLTKAFYQSMS